MNVVDDRARRGATATESRAEWAAEAHTPAGVHIPVRPHGIDAGKRRFPRSDAQSAYELDRIDLDAPIRTISDRMARREAEGWAFCGTARTEAGDVYQVWTHRR